MVLVNLQNDGVLAAGVASVITVCEVCFPTSVNVTLASGTTAADGSLMTPVIDPEYSCAWAQGTNKANRQSSAIARRVTAGNNRAFDIRCSLPELIYQES